MTTAEQLTKARDLISDPNNWVTGVLAADNLGIKTAFRYATKFCASGALCKAGVESDAIQCLQNAARQMGYVTIPGLNDNTDHNTVMEMFDLAIRLAKEEE